MNLKRKMKEKVGRGETTDLNTVVRYKYPAEGGINTILNDASRSSHNKAHTPSFSSDSSQHHFLRWLFSRQTCAFPVE